MRILVFGREIQVERQDSKWRVWYSGTGTRRPAEDLVIPDDLDECAIPDYLADLCHEWARPGADEVRILSD